MNEIAKITAPVAKKITSYTTYHNIDKIDEYAWLRADNWQQVLQNPHLLNSEIRQYLEAENSYQSDFMQDSLAVQEKLF